LLPSDSLIVVLLHWDELDRWPDLAPVEVLEVVFSGAVGVGLDVGGDGAARDGAAWDDSDWGGITAGVGAPAVAADDAVDDVEAAVVAAVVGADAFDVRVAAVG
jgi:hypothetical protein